MLRKLAWVFTFVFISLLTAGMLIIYVIDTDSSFPFGAGFMVMAAPIFGVIAAVLWAVEITKTNRDQK